MSQNTARFTLEDLIVKRLWVEGKRIQTLDLGALVVSDPNYNVGIGTDTPTVILDISGTSGLRLPVGTTSERPNPSNLSGIIRYNSSTNSYEGYNMGGWTSLGGTTSIDQQTKIEADNNDGLKFITDNVERMRIKENGVIDISTNVDVSGTIAVENLDVSNNVQIYGHTNVKGGHLVIDDQYSSISDAVSKLEFKIRNNFNTPSLVGQILAVNDGTSPGNGKLKFQVADNSNYQDALIIDKDKNVTFTGSQLDISGGDILAQRIGIGTDSPANKLDVFGSISLYGNDGTVNINAFTLPDIYLDCKTGGSNTGSNGIVWKTRDANYSKFSAKIVFEPDGSYYNGGLTFYTSNSNDSTTDAVERMRITSDGKIGIGIDNPTDKLDVVGNIILSSSNDIVRNSTDTNTTETYYGNLERSIIRYADRNYRENSGYPSSLGKTHEITFGYTLDNLQTYTSTDLKLHPVNNAIKFKLINGSSSTLTPDTKMTILGNGNVGIGTTSPDARLHIKRDNEPNDNSHRALLIDAYTGVQGGENSIHLRDIYPYSGYKGHIISLSRLNGNHTEPVLCINPTTNDAIDDNNRGLFIEHGGNVGIGTTSPQAKLDINDIRTSSNQDVLSNDECFRIYTGAPDGSDKRHINTVASIVERTTRTGSSPPTNYSHMYSLVMGIGAHPTIGFKTKTNLQGTPTAVLELAHNYTSNTASPEGDFNTVPLGGYNVSGSGPRATSYYKTIIIDANGNSFFNGGPVAFGSDTVNSAGSTKARINLHDPIIPLPSNGYEPANSYRNGIVFQNDLHSAGGSNPPMWSYRSSGKIDAARIWYQPRSYSSSIGVDSTLAAVHGTLNFGVGNVQQRNTNDNRHYTESTIPSITISSEGYYSGSVGIHTKEPNEPFVVTSNDAHAFVVQNTAGINDTNGDNMVRINASGPGNDGYIQSANPGCIIGGYGSTNMLRLQRYHSSDPGSGFGYYMDFRSGHHIDTYNSALYLNHYSENNVLICGQGGNVGIGTTSPTQAALQIDSYVDNGSTTQIGSYFMNSGSYNHSSSSWMQTADVNGRIYLGLRVKKGIWCKQLNYDSDMRIKENIRDVSDNYALQKLRDISAVYYEYKDKIDRGFATTIGFIAQQVKDHMPMAVYLQKEIIPSEMRNIENPQWTMLTDSSGNNTFKLTINDLNDNSGNTLYRFYVSNDPSGNDECKKDVSSLDTEPKSFIFDQSWNYVFIYGEQVDDFHTLDKEKLFSLNFSATQEIDRIQQQEKTKLEEANQKILELEAKNQQLETTLQQVLQRLDALENN